MSSLKIIGIVAGAVLVVFVVGSLVVKAAMLNSAPADTDLANAMDNASAAADVRDHKWVYSEDTDALRKTIRHFANMDSDNKADVAGVGSDPSYLGIMVRRDHHGDDVMFRISQGQFMCSVEGCTGAISIDGHEHSIALNPPNDGGSDVIFAKSGAPLAKELAGAKQVIVELPFFQHGNVQFTFSPPEPLKWPPADKG